MGHGGQFREKLLDIFEENSWTFCRHGGNHTIYENSETGQRMAIPSKLNDRHLGNKILRGAGIKNCQL